MILPYDTILEIAKHCHYSALLSLSRTCRQFAAKIDENEANDMSSIYTGTYKVEITRCPIWRAAMEAQFPAKKHLSFYSDDLNYFLAKAGSFRIIIDTIHYEISHIYQANKISNYIHDFVYGYCSENLYEIFISDIGDRFLVSELFDRNVIGYYPTFAEAEKGAEIIEESVIIDLKYTSIMFKNDTIARLNKSNGWNYKFITDESEEEAGKDFEGDYL